MSSGRVVPEELPRFLARFDQGEYWLAHEELERLWLRERDEFSKGLIHLAAGLLHARRRNWRGAHAKISSAWVLLGAASPTVKGVHLEELRAAVKQLCAVADDHLVSGGGDGSLLPVLKLAPFFPTVTAMDVESIELPYRVRRYDAGYRPGRDAHRRD